ncbi:hypothetical protein [Methylobacterium sp. ID0610]|uniref:hypothetical protein n=1 Tax=Methylobacterium carpenticola TaxID=3344827 RepID=UPI00367F256B
MLQVELHHVLRLGLAYGDEARFKDEATNGGSRCQRGRQFVRTGRPGQSSSKSAAQLGSLA